MGERVVVERRAGGVWRIGLGRPEKRNAFDLAMLRGLAEAYTAFDDDPDARCAVLHGLGDHFTAGLDLGEVGPAVASGAPLFPTSDTGSTPRVDPLGLGPRRRTKPVVVAVRGWCLTIGIELALAADIVIAAPDAKFGQIEVNRGIFPFGGATLRMHARVGWGDAMRWLLTGDTFDAAEAHRIGLVQQLADDPLAVATAIADTIAKRAPLGVQATLRSARTAVEQGPEVAADALLGEARALMASEDAAEGLRSFLERRDGVFRGR